MRDALTFLRAPRGLLPSPTPELAAVSLQQVRREGRFLFHLAFWAIGSLYLGLLQLLTSGLGVWWSLWASGSWGLVVAVHGYFAEVLGRRRYRVAHVAVAETARHEEAGDGLRAKLLDALATAREVLRGSRPELLADLARGEAHALATLAWLDLAGQLLARGEGAEAQRRQVAALLSRSGHGKDRRPLERLLRELDLHQTRSVELEREKARRSSLLTSFLLALEGAAAARGDGEMLAAVSGSIRDRITLLDTAGAGAGRSSDTAPEAPSALWQEEVRLARQLQRSILPRQAPVVDGLTVAHLYHPSSEVGGDFYDFYSLSAGRLLTALGDASGHGIDSSMISSMAKSALYAHVSAGRGAAETMAEMNRMMWDTLGRRRLMSLALLDLDAESRTLSWVNAGQVYPLVKSGGTVRELEAPSYPLGVRATSAYPTREEPLEAGDILVIFTDGYVEATDAGGEPYGWERLRRHLGQLETTDVDEVVRRLAEALWAYVGEELLQDDVTLVAIGLDR